MVGLVKLVLQSGKALSLSFTSQVCHSMARDALLHGGKQWGWPACTLALWMTSSQQGLRALHSKVHGWPWLVSTARECTAPSVLQVRAAAEEYHAEFAAKETTIITLTAEAEATRAHMQGEIEKLRTEMEVSAAVTERSWILQLPRQLTVSPST